jgi:8-oxo-dGTP pyrophosphatase MutT (NUDIX family)
MYLHKLPIYKLFDKFYSNCKFSWPGYLDNSVAGGIPSGMSAFQAMVKESMEEASIAEDVARSYLKAVGAISYFFR